MTLREYAVVVPYDERHVVEMGQQYVDEVGMQAVREWNRRVDAEPGATMPERVELRMTLGRVTWPDDDATEGTFHGGQEGPGTPAIWVCGGQEGPGTPAIWVCGWVEAED